METQLEMLEAQALKLTTSEWAHLAERLIASLDEDGEIEEAWAVEVQRRIAHRKRSGGNDSVSRGDRTCSRVIRVERSVSPEGGRELIDEAFYAERSDRAWARDRQD